MPKIRIKKPVTSKTGETYIASIFKQYSDFVYNVIYRMLENHPDSEEILQDVFFTVHKKIDSFKNKSSLKTWLYRIAVNKTLNHIKTKKRERNLKNILANNTNDIFQENLYTNDIKENIEQENNNYLVSRLLECLNPDQKICVILRNIDGLSYAQIADILEININTVKTRLKRARNKMIKHSKEIKNEL